MIAATTAVPATAAPAVLNPAGTSVLGDGPALDLVALRADRRRRLFRAMADHDLDVLVLGRPAEVSFATGARQLWTSGTRPFGPACVVVGATGRTHLLSVSDDGVPTEISHAELFGLSWNPANLVASLAAIPGVSGARRVGTTSSSPGLPRMIEAIATGAEVVDGAEALWSARAAKSADEVACMATATATAEAGLTAMVDALRPGASERDLLAALLSRIAALGAPNPSSEGVACATEPKGRVRLRRLASGQPIGDGQLVVLDAGASFAGYEGGVGRTWPAGSDDASDAQIALGERCRALLAAIRAACRAGATGADLLQAWRSTGEPFGPEPIAMGMGLGAEPPVIGDGVGEGSVLVPGMVLAVTAWVSQVGVGGFAERDVLVVGDGDAQVLGRYGRGPAGGGR